MVRFSMFTCGASALLVTAVSGLASAGARAEDPPVVPFGYAEGYYQWNLGDPSNHITNFRGFDNRHNSFTLDNAVLGVHWNVSGAIGQIALQVGAAGATFYSAEPSAPGSGFANATDPGLWKYLQEGWAGYHFDSGLELTAGLFFSPLGYETFAVKDNWNFSRSNLYFAMPGYHAGLRALVPLSKTWVATFAVVNGINAVVDNNDAKSVLAVFDWTPSSDFELYFSVLTGNERARHTTESVSWRTMFDANAAWTVSPKVTMALHLDGMFEPNKLGTSYWFGAAVYARFQLAEKLFLAGRADFLNESKASKDGATASAVALPVDWVASGTLTLDWRPLTAVSFMLEVRHDEAAAPMYFEGRVAGDGSAGAPYLVDAKQQTSVTLGVTAGF